MKKISIACFILILGVKAFSQQAGDSMDPEKIPAIHILKEPRFMLNIHSGYSMGLGSTFKFYPDDVSNITVTQNGTNGASKIINYSNPTKGLGDGIKFGFGVSYILNDFINIGLDFDYFNSTIKKVRDSSFHQTNITTVPGMFDEYSYGEHNVISYDATLLSLTPSITFKAISKPKWFLYNKIGAIITFRPNSLQKDVTNYKTQEGWQGFYHDSASTVSKNYEWGIRNPAYGFMGAVGVQTKLSNKLRLFAELQFSHIVFVIQKRTLTDYIVDGTHLENSLSKNVRELDFVRSFSTDASNVNPDMPSQTIIQRIPITYLGLQIGLAYQLK
ncbi:MAG: hypothetical protein ABI402_07695 [Ferruginibacter sp.]